VGQVLQALDDSGQADNTIVIFTSDNGGERFSKTWPFTGQKTELLEGGIRVPTLLRWSARIQPQVQEQVTASFDWLPTLLAAAGARPHPDFPATARTSCPYWKATRPKPSAACSGATNPRPSVPCARALEIPQDQRQRVLVQCGGGRPRARQSQGASARIFAGLRRQWEQWNEQLLPITAENYSHGLSPDIQADRYVPARLSQG
jgi:hypothetical protein